jgi:plastocyanin
MSIQGFSPDSVTIAAGQVVRFHNIQAIGHTSTSGTVSGGMGTPDGKWDTGSLMQNESACVRIDAAGTHPYYCIPHPVAMQGTIIVQ